MNTPTHLIMGAALFSRAGDRGRTWGAIAGSFAPDLSLYLMASAALAMGIPAGRVFGELYYSAAWQQVFAVDNSFVLWALAFAVAWWSGRGWAIAFTGAALIHLAFDFPLHSHDARAHFWPLTDWKFISPVSYWEGEGGRLVGMLELALVVVLGAILLVRHSDWRARAGFAAIGAAQLAPAILWPLLL